MIEGKLWRFESVRPEYWNNTHSAGVTGKGYLRFVDVATGAATPSFGPDHALGCAVYDAASKTVHVFATNDDSSGGGGVVDVFSSTDGMQVGDDAAPGAPPGAAPGAAPAALACTDFWICRRGQRRRRHWTLWRS